MNFNTTQFNIRPDIYQLTTLIKNNNFIPKSFLEIGSRDGHDTYMIRNFWKINDADCYIVEPHPELYKSIKNLYPYFNVFNCAASNKTQPIKFNAGTLDINNNVGVSSVLNRTYDSDFIFTEIYVDAWRVDDIFNFIGLSNIDLVKIDVEGHAYEVLNGFGIYINSVKYIQIELETKEVWKDQKLSNDVINFMIKNNFEIISEIKLDEFQTDFLFKNNKL